MLFMKSKEDLLLELMDVMHTRERFTRAIDKLKTDNPNIAVMLNSPLMPDTAAYINEVFDIGAYELTIAAAQLYGTVLNKKDVKEMVRFYKYGPGRKFVENLAGLEKGTEEILVSWMTTAYANIGTKAASELEISKRAVDNMEVDQTVIPEGTKLH